jgi:hypothetical protein
VAAEKAAKAAKAKALEVTKAEAMASLATIEMDQECAEANQHRRVIRRQPSVWDVTTYNVSEEFDLGFLGETDDHGSDPESEATLPDAVAAAAAFRQTKVSVWTEISIYWKDLTISTLQIHEAKGETFSEPQKEMQLKKDNSGHEARKRCVMMSVIRDKLWSTHTGLSVVATPLPVASGLKDKWKNKSTRNGLGGLVRDATVAVPSFQVGGLSDEHVSGVPPKFEKRTAGRAASSLVMMDEVSPYSSWLGHVVLIWRTNYRLLVQYLPMRIVKTRQRSRFKWSPHWQTRKKVEALFLGTR